MYYLANHAGGHLNFFIVNPIGIRDVVLVETGDLWNNVFSLWKKNF
jgi:hypothetical protein